MSKNKTTKALLAACILIVGILSSIQVYLVGNTYQLTKQNYYAEVRRLLIGITNLPAATSFEEQARENLRLAIDEYLARRLTKAAFIQLLCKNNQDVKEKSNQYINHMTAKIPLLRHTHYKAQFDEITYQLNGKSDTLLTSNQKPVVFNGTNFKTDKNVYLSKFVTNSIGDDLTIVMKQSNYIDVSSWQKEVFKRMYGILFLAIGLIIAVIVLFYLIFRVLIRQKKLAEIRTDFANNITHELKTPLSSVSLILKSALLKNVQQQPELLDSLLQSLNRQHGKIRQIVDSVLESAMAGTIVVEMEKVEITSFLHEYFDDLALERHSLSLDILPQSVMLNTNTETLEKILNILVDNASKYSDPQKAIQVKCFVTGTHYHIEITDCGPGIPQEHQAQIFDKFYRIPERNTHTVKGLGLGLYLGQQAALQIGATLTVKSSAGIGSTFIISLDL